jgi:ADP-ribose pyrophosphatase YjhB (NUDIX family)
MNEYSKCTKCGCFPNLRGFCKCYDAPSKLNKPVPHLLVATDIIIEVGKDIVIIKRKNEPLGYALPGGIVDPGESVEEAAIREAKEETSLDVKLKYLLGVYSKPGRDPRGPCMSVTYVAEAFGQPKGADDAKEAYLDDPYVVMKSDMLVFDHNQIIQDYLFKNPHKLSDRDKNYTKCEICGGSNH